jgi:peptidoglycan/LPS O-acetylase OafA/YrhL
MGGLFVYEGGRGNYNSFFELITLANPGINHLWTISVEFRYYFFIPPLCLLFYYANALGYYLHMLCLFTVAIYYMFCWVFSLTNMQLALAYFFASKFPIFFAGSYIALITYKLNTMLATTSLKQQQQDMSNRTTNNKLSPYRKIAHFVIKATSAFIANESVKFCLGIFGVLYCSYGFRMFSSLATQGLMAHDEHNPMNINAVCVYYIVMQIVFMAGNPNFLTRFFSHNYIFELAGKYSFGIYLLHPICLLVKTFYYDKLEERGEGAATIVEMVINTFVLCYFAGFFFFYLIENPLMKLSNKICRYINSIDNSRTQNEAQNGALRGSSGSERLELVVSKEGSGVFNRKPVEYIV